MLKKKKRAPKSGKARKVSRVAKTRIKKVRKAVAKRNKGPKAATEIGLEKIGEVTHYFPHVKAAAVMILKDSLKVGDKIYIKGHTTDFKENINSIQLDRVPIEEGRKGQEIGLLVKSRVRIGDSVYRL
jgi:hypothetical protein